MGPLVPWRVWNYVHVLAGILWIAIGTDQVYSYRRDIPFDELGFSIPMLTASVLSVGAMFHHSSPPWMQWVGWLVFLCTIPFHLADSLRETSQSHTDSDNASRDTGGPIFKSEMAISSAAILALFLLAVAFVPQNLPQWETELLIAALVALAWEILVTRVLNHDIPDTAKRVGAALILALFTVCMVFDVSAIRHYSTALAPPQYVAAITTDVVASAFALNYVIGV